MQIQPNNYIASAITVIDVIGIPEKSLDRAIKISFDLGSFAENRKNSVKPPEAYSISDLERGGLIEREAY